MAEKEWKSPWKKPLSDGQVAEAILMGAESWPSLTGAINPRRASIQAERRIEFYKTEIEGMGEKRDWSELLKDLLQLICKRLVFVHDHLGFSSVCSWWRSVVVEIRSRNIPPALITPRRQNLPSGLFSIVQRELEGETQGRQLVQHLPLYHYICGSSHGWLVVTDACLNAYLMNPFSGAEILLPPLPNRRYIIQKAVLSSPVSLPDVSTSIVFVIAIVKEHGYNLAFCRLGGNAWSSIESYCSKYSNIISFRDQLYAHFSKDEEHIDIYDIGDGRFSHCKIV
ncbi:hypothetical protein GIB67_014971 [Kingdonia uniflora]|uniref:KIB1-4 beta-propeller domain-containing protein n=1 Tax=Kingdonia uniflora TaxID=39325 RepID=A0A7J7MTM5_9MAGN|nr:hypothetical protein GIB67_014971 [Kingdonia uniflora]